MKMSNSVFKETTGAGEEAQSGGTTAEGAHSGEKTTNFRTEMQMLLRFGRVGWGRCTDLMRELRLSEGLCFQKHPMEAGDFMTGD